MPAKLRGIRPARASLVLVAVLAIGCDSGQSARTADPPVAFAPKASESIPADAHRAAGDTKSLKTGPFEKSFEGIRFSVPAGWREVELAPAQQGFIDARFQIPTPHGDVTLTFSSNGGGIDTNVRRWVGQFHPPSGKQPVVEELDVAGKKATWVDLIGEFDAGPMGGNAAPISGAPPVERMLGVAIPLGSRDFYLKLRGSDAAVTDVRAAFREFARDARLSN
jgi:hypothetical protein